MADLRTPIRPTVIPAAVARQEFETHVLRTFTPTPLPELRPRLMAPTAVQMQEATSAYETFFADFSAFRKEMDPVLGNALLEGKNLQQTLHPTELSYYITRLGNLRLRSNSLQNVLFPSDAALKGVREYIDFTMQKFDKLYTPEVSVLVRPDRPYVQEEFWMEYDWRKGPRRIVNPAARRRAYGGAERYARYFGYVQTMGTRRTFPERVEGFRLRRYQRIAGCRQSGLQV